MRKKSKEIINIRKVIRIRINIIKGITFIVFLFLMFKITHLIIFQNDIYAYELDRLTNVLVEGGSSPRGRIYDRNYKLLVDNKVIPVVFYKKTNKVTTTSEIDMAYLVAEKLEIDYSKLTKRDLKDYWVLTNKELSNRLITKEEWKKLDNRILNNEDIYNLKIDRVLDEELDKYDEFDRESIYIYFLMNKGYLYEEKEIKNSDLSDEEIAFIAENADILKGFDIRYNWERVYPYGNAFRSILGNISTIPKEEKDNYLARGYALSDIVGVSYIEKQYEDYLKGKKATYSLISSDKKLIVSEGSRGNDIVLTIDIDIQIAIDRILKEEIAKTRWEPATELFNHSYVVIQNPKTGEILAMSGLQLIRKGNDIETVDITPGVITNPMTPGSVVKGASHLVGYMTGAINVGEVKRDECIKLYSKPSKCSWRTLGNINDITALSQSSNVYQFKTAMKVAGFDYTYNKRFTEVGEAFNTYRDVFNMFGLGVKTGVDLPIESIGNVGVDKSADLFLNYAIGQYDTYTTMQLSQYVTTIANNGNRMQPHLLKGVYSSATEEPLKNLIYEFEPIVLNTIDTKKEYIARIQQGFREVMVSGLGKRFMGNAPSPAGKTGTSESFLDTDGDGNIDTPTLSNAFVGYAPYDDPIMSIAVTYPNIVNSNSNSNSRSSANIRMTRLISEKFFELYKN